MDNKFQINPNCDACPLHKSAKPKSICLKGRNCNGTKKLIIYTDHPDYFADNSQRGYSLDTGKILDWMLKRMSIDPEQVAYDYTLRCYPGKGMPTTKAGRLADIEECSHYRFATIAKLKPRALVVLGQTSLEAFTGKTRIGQYEGQNLICWEGVVRDYCDNVWIGYSLNYILLYPSDTYRVFRVIYNAAEQAGLKPKLDPTIPPFRWRNIK